MNIPANQNAPNSKDAYKVKLEDVFEGPMDLLIHVIKKNEVDIYDIPIALITEQYLVYLELIQLLNIDNVGDFLLMAATLAHIKSRTLLPTHGDEDDDEDPRLEIVRPLAEYLRIKAAAETLANRDLLGDKIFSRRVKTKAYFSGDDEMVQVGLFELIDAFQRVLDKVSKDHTVDLATEEVSVKDRMNEIVTVLESRGSIVFKDLFTKGAKKPFFIASFLALLELMKMNLVRVAQNKQDGILRLFYQ